MDVDQQPHNSKRQRVDLPATAPTSEPAIDSSSSASSAASRSSIAPPASGPAVLRGRPPLTRSNAELQAAAARFACSVCGKVLQNAYKLDRHTRTHSGDLPFACQLCDAKFSDQHNANRHQRTCGLRKGVEQAMQTITLSWPLWSQQPDEEEEEQQEYENGIDGTDGEERRDREKEAEKAGAAGLPRLNRWLFPQQRSNAADDAVT